MVVFPPAQPLRHESNQSLPPTALQPYSLHPLLLLQPHSGTSRPLVLPPSIPPPRLLFVDAGTELPVQGRAADAALGGQKLHAARILAVPPNGPPLHLLCILGLLTAV